MSANDLYRNSMKLPSLDELFSTEQDRQDANLEKVRSVAIAELFAFKDHPFQVRDDEEMEKMAESIKTYGVLTPAIVRPRAEGGYEMIAGHRRKRACELASVKEMPVIVREMDDDTAIILMVDSNFQRENVSTMEKAKAFKMKLEAVKRQAGRPQKNSSQLGTNFRADEKVADDAGESRMQVQRYIRLNELIPELQEMVEDNKLKFNPAVELSFLSEDEQRQVCDYLDSEARTPSLSQAQQLKAASKDKAFSKDRLKEIMDTPRPALPAVRAREPQERSISIPIAQVERFFPKDATPEQMLAQIIRILEIYQRKKEKRHPDLMER